MLEMHSCIVKDEDMFFVGVIFFTDVHSDCSLCKNVIVIKIAISIFSRFKSTVGSKTVAMFEGFGLSAMQRLV